MANELLLDTGALVSLVDRSQSRHDSFVSYFREWNGRVISTEAVLTEATHLLGRIERGREACLEFVLAGGCLLIPTSHDALSRARNLMVKYRDLPMDYADASLVVLAEEVGTNLILTTDRRDFAVYRAFGRTPFEILPNP